MSLKCKRCGADVPATAGVCPKCHANLVTTLSEPSTSAATTKRCPECNTEYPVQAEFCRVDGYQFPKVEGTAAPPITSVPTTSGPLKICPQCGTANLQSAKFCVQDGYRFDSTATSAGGGKVCPACGFRNAPGARFCRQDGTSLIGPQPGIGPTTLDHPGGVESGPRIAAPQTPSSLADALVVAASSAGPPMVDPTGLPGPDVASPLDHEVTILIPRRERRAEAKPPAASAVRDSVAPEAHDASTVEIESGARAPTGIAVHQARPTAATRTVQRLSPGGGTRVPGATNRGSPWRTATLIASGIVALVAIVGAAVFYLLWPDDSTVATSAGPAGQARAGSREPGNFTADTPTAGATAALPDATPVRPPAEVDLVRSSPQTTDRGPVADERGEADGRANDPRMPRSVASMPKDDSIGRVAAAEAPGARPSPATGPAGRARSPDPRSAAKATALAQPPAAPPPPPPARPDRAKLEGEINQALRNAGLGNVTAQVADDLTVLLKGSLPTTADKTRALQIARGYGDATGVKDRVFVVE